MGNPSKAQPSTISGFTVLPVIYSRDATHYMYAKAHSGGGSKKSGAESKVLPTGRTLFIVNVPPDATERELVLFFKSAGTVEKVIFDQRDAEEKELSAPLLGPTCVHLFPGTRGYDAGDLCPARNVIFTAPPPASALVTSSAFARAHSPPDHKDELDMLTVLCR